MDYTVRKVEHRRWPVSISTRECDEEGNVTEVQRKFVGIFRAFTEADHQVIVDEMTAKFNKPEEAEADASVGTTDKKPETRISAAEIQERNAWYFNRLLVGWGKGIMDEHGQPLAHSPEMVRRLVTGVDGDAIAAGLVAAITQLRFGIAPAKNSKTSPEPGAAPGAGEVATNLPTT